MSMLHTRPPASPTGVPIPHPTAMVEQVWPRLAQLETTYPGFRAWFWGKVAPGLEIGDRRVFIHAGSASVDGVVIAKRNASERKLCTIWVAPEARGRRIASDLVDEAIDWLEDPLPLLTVPEERLAELTPLARSRGFELSQAIESCYRAGRTEYVFNGRLRRRADC